MDGLLLMLHPLQNHLLEGYPDSPSHQPEKA